MTSLEILEGINNYRLEHKIPSLTGYVVEYKEKFRVLYCLSQ